MLVSDSLKCFIRVHATTGFDLCVTTLNHFYTFSQFFCREFSARIFGWFIDKCVEKRMKICVARCLSGNGQLVELIVR